MAKKSTENQARYDKKYIEKYYLKLHKINDSDIITAIDIKNKQGSIKKLIREAINKRNDLD